LYYAQPVIVVSGLPRSGTSLMMKMLTECGLELVHTGDSPDGDCAWLELAEGKLVRVPSPRLVHLPSSYSYKVIFMQRRVASIPDSQTVVLTAGQGTSPQVDGERVAQLSKTHLRRVYSWMDAQPNVTYVDVQCERLVGEPKQVLQEIDLFLEGALKLDQAKEVH
jgi:hypothetical protein